MRFACISDIHNDMNLIEELKKVKADCILISGDLSQLGSEYEILEILYHLSKIKKDIIFIAGNHDNFIEKHFDFIKEFDKINRYKNMTYLKDTMFNYNGIKIYGTPYVLNSSRWCFNLTSDKYFEQHLPKEVPDILLTHIPPKITSLCSFDVPFGTMEIGSQVLLDYIKNNNVQYHICGHIHECGGCDVDVAGTKVFNVAEHIRIIEL